LGSTAASRSLVVFDDVPLNDPFGGWVHWGELPKLAVHAIEAVRGGASDLYGSSAIGGVVSILPERPQGDTFQLSLSGGTESLLDNSLLASGKVGAWSGLVAGGVTATDGYTLVAPSLRGRVDQPSSVHAENALVEGERAIGERGRLFLRSNALNELRHNGTFLQYNGTRLWRGAGGADWDHLSLRFFGSNEHYRQTFSNIAASRATETLTRFGFDPADELGAQARWRQPISTHALVVAGSDVRDIRAEDRVTLFTGAGGVLNTSAHQRQTGAYSEALITPHNWTISAGGRVDHFSNFDPRQFGASAQPLPAFSETVFNPRLGLVRRVTSSLAFNASGFRAYRAPTENELYRTGQVGQQITQPNPNLRSERATGWETGFQTDLHRYGTSLRASYYWTQVNRPITALRVSRRLVFQ
jgi:outer membrane receptor protein involved in Fe transport